MYKRVLLKLSGESLGGPSGKGLDEQRIAAYASQIVSAVRSGHQVAVVNGGGNIFRGLQGSGKGFDRVDGDKMGMLATVINSMALAQFIREQGVRAEVFTATPMEPIARYYVRDAAVRLLEEGGVALIAGGTGNPFFTTDSGAALRALEIGADAVLKGTRVDGVYTADPEKDPTAVKYDELTFSKALADHLKVMDATAFALCEQGNVPIVVFNIDQDGALADLLEGKKVGTNYRVGKANPAVFNKVLVNYYGTPTPIPQVASVTTPDAKTLAIQPWERSLIPAIEKAIIDSNIGLTPSNNGETIRCSVPALTEERRKELVKSAKV